MTKLFPKRFVKIELDKRQCTNATGNHKKNRAIAPKINAVQVHIYVLISVPEVPAHISASSVE